MTNDFHILQILLNVYTNKGNTEKQRHILNKLHKLQPKNVMVRVNMANNFLKEGQIAEAE
jgi:hypothetical protein